MMVKIGTIMLGLALLVAGYANANALFLLLGLILTVGGAIMSFGRGD